MNNPFTIRIFVPEGDPEGIRIVDRLNSTGKFFAFPRTAWEKLKSRSELNHPGIYVLSGYANPDDELPTIYIGQADSVRNRIEQHIRMKEFWDKAIIFVARDINSAHTRWLEYALIKRAIDANRCFLENGNNPQEPPISESEKADMEVFLKEIYQTLPLVGTNVFELPRIVARPDTDVKKGEKDTIVVPAREEGFMDRFIGQNAWWTIRISGGMLNKIRYIAAYRTAPISAITHYAEVDRIVPFGEEGKYKLIFKGPAKELETKIPFGDSPQGLMQGPKYTNFEKLKKAKQVSDLF